MEILDFTGTKYLERADSRPTFGGTATSEIGKTGSVALIQFGGQNYTVEIGLDGKFSWTSPVDVADGEYSLSIIIQDRAGNQSSPILRTAIIDTTPPEAPTLLNLYDDHGDLQGSFDSGKITDDARPTLTGIAQKGSVVMLLNSDNQVIGSAQADSKTGVWVLEPAQDLPDGDNALHLVASEVFANTPRTGSDSAVFHIVVGQDGLPPGSISISDAFDDAGSVTGTLSDGALTDDVTPTLNGTATAGSTVVIYYRLAGSDIWAGSATATLTGEKWSWTPDAALAAGHYEFQARNADKASALFTLEIANQDDILARTRIDSVFDDVAPSTGLLESGALTDDSTPAFRGSAEANSQITLRYTLAGGESATLTVNADSRGQWNWTPQPALAAGSWIFEVQAQGQTAWSDAFSLQIAAGGDSSLDPVILYADDNAGADTGQRNHGDVTDDTTPTLHGRAEANSVVYLRYSSAGMDPQLISVTADAASNWAWEPPTDLAIGDWLFEVSASGTSDWQAFSLSIAPDVSTDPLITHVWDDVGVTGNVPENGRTNDTRPTVHGTGIADSTIILKYTPASGAAASVTVNVGADGSWAWTPSANLKKGGWTFEVFKTGETSGDSFTLIIDSTFDRNAVITKAFDNVGFEQQDLMKGDTTDDTRPELVGTGPADTVIQLRYRLASGEYAQASVTTDASGNWRWTPDSDLATGTWTFEAQKAGQSDWSSFSLKIDPESGNNPTILYAEDNFGNETGAIYSGDSTDDKTPTFIGQGEPNSIIVLRLKKASAVTYTVKVDADGTWRYSDLGNLSNGAYELSVRKNTQDSAWSDIFKLKIDDGIIPLPSAPSFVIYDDFGPVSNHAIGHYGFSDDFTPTLKGDSAPPNGIVYIEGFLKYSPWNSLGSVVADSNGKWEFNPGTLNKSGPWWFRANTLAPDAEVKSKWTPAYIVNIHAPGDHFKAKITSVLGDNGEVVENGSVVTNEISVKGTALPYEKIHLSITKENGGGKSYSISADINGNWDLMTTFMSQGSGRYTITASTSDTAGVNYSTTFAFRIVSSTSSLNDIQENDGGEVMLIDSNDEDSGYQLLSSHQSSDGKTAEDTLVLLGKDQMINLSEANTLLDNITHFDITGTGDNTIQLDLSALLAHSKQDLLIEDGKTQLVVKGDAGDVVQLKDILPEGSDLSEWQHQEGTVTVAGVEYQVYSHGDDAELLVQQGVKTELI